MKVMLMRIVLILTMLTFFNPSSLLAATEQRTALVIGNSAYSSGPLRNPVNDATDMAAVLKKLGFSVTLKKNAGEQEMDEAIREFGRQLKRTRGVGLFFYAGHGIQINGVNYLLPVNARIEKESDVRFNSINADMVLAEMENAENGSNIVILDACRDNPFARSFRNVARGLAIISNAPAGTFISYSTGANQVARDGDGKNSPYTKALLENIDKPGLSINNVFMKVRSKVKKQTGQIPWELSSLEGDFYFVPEKTSQTVAAKQEAVSHNDQLQTERITIEERQKLAYAPKVETMSKLVESIQIVINNAKIKENTHELLMTVRLKTDKNIWAQYMVDRINLSYPFKKEPKVLLADARIEMPNSIPLLYDWEPNQYVTFYEEKNDAKAIANFISLYLNYIVKKPVTESELNFTIE